MKKIALLLCLLAYPSYAKELSEGFSKYNNSSYLQISYTDLSALYDVIVLENFENKRQVDRQRKSKQFRVGRKSMEHRNNHVANEANRVLLHSANDTVIEQAAKHIRMSLQSVPEQIDFSQLHQKEQLVFWLNLYNIGLIEKTLSIYPRYKLEDESQDEDGYLSEKFIQVAGQSVSLKDIQYRIVYPLFGEDKKVIYGFPQGYLGSPQINAKAFNSVDIDAQLSELANEFINSNRGLFIDTQGRVSGSKYYESHLDLFNGMKSDLVTHWLEYADEDLKNALTENNPIEFGVTAWSMFEALDMRKELGDKVDQNTNDELHRLLDTLDVEHENARQVILLLKEINTNKAPLSRFYGDDIESVKLTKS
ncbi:hypothetical protein PALB_14620 [Pseudoalteromonas luteoviolacea B = ATCC 29581]|nr:hypothetical protein PALB_14620 [Pseudoalteromonas luteoviolacea B = ATCC 29581]